MTTRLLCSVLLVFGSRSLLAERGSDAEWRPAIVDVVFIKKPTPEYPLHLRRAHVTGYGFFRMYISKQGEVTAIKIVKSTGNRDLDAVAMKGLIQWRAKPGPKREFDIPICFAMTQSRNITPTPPPLPQSRMRVIQN